MDDLFSCQTANLNEGVLTPSVWRVDNRTMDEDLVTNAKVVAGFLLVFFLVGLPLNVLVIFTIVKKKLYHQPTLLLLLNLALTDLLLCLLVMPFNIVSGMTGEFIFGESDRVRCQVCETTGFFISFLSLLSFHTVTLMAVDRMVYLMRPLDYSTLITAKRTLVLVIAVWLVCLGLAVPPLFGFGAFEFGVISACVPVLAGELTNISYNILLLAEVALVVLVFLTANIGMVVIVHRHLVMAYKLHRSYLNSKTNSRSPPQAKRNRTQFYLARMFLAVVVTNLVTWSPIIVLVITEVAFLIVPVYPISVAYLSLLSQCVLHPLVETILVKETRRIIKNAWTQMYMCTNDLLEISMTEAGSEELGESAAMITGCCRRCGCLEVCGELAFPNNQ